MPTWFKAMPQGGRLLKLGNNAWCHLGQLQYRKFVMKPPQIGNFFVLTCGIKDNIGHFGSFCPVRWHVWPVTPSW